MEGLFYSEPYLSPHEVIFTDVLARPLDLIHSFKIYIKKSILLLYISKDPRKENIMKCNLKSLPVDIVVLLSVCLAIPFKTGAFGSSLSGYG